MVAVVTLVAIESLTRILLLLGRRAGVGSILRWRRLVVVLVTEAAEPTALVVLRLVVGVVVVEATSTTGGHPAGAVHGLHAGLAAAAVLDARPGDEEHDEEGDNDGSENPSAVVVPA